MYVPYTSTSHQPDTQVVKHLLFVLSGGCYFVRTWREQMFLYPVSPEIVTQFTPGRTDENIEPINVMFVFHIPSPFIIYLWVTQQEYLREPPANPRHHNSI